MYTPAADEHARRIRRVHEIIRTEESFKSEYTQELAAYLFGFEEKARKGMFEELSDVSLYQWDGTDSNGLDLWLSKRGSTRAENFHQKLMAALGPWGVGAQTAHYIMLLVTFRYNVKAGIRRSNEHNFGHPYLQCIDRIQMHYLNIWGIDVFPRHKNLSQFSAVPGYSPVGIGPLHYSGEFVKEGAPHKLLKGDIKFTSERQGLECSPRHVRHPKEMKIFNDFMETHPNPSSKDWIELAKLFKQKTDYIHVFPKLPSMLRTYYKRWQDSQKIVLAEMQVKGQYDALLFDLALPVSRSEIPAVAQQEQPSRSVPLLVQAQQSVQNAAQRQQQQQQQQQVLPLAAPAQKEFVGSRVQLAGKKRPRQRCCNELFGCTKYADECNGFRSELCSELIAGRISVPETEEQQSKQAKGVKQRKEKEKQQQQKDKRKEKQKQQLLQTDKIAYLNVLFYDSFVHYISLV